eukprot:3227876-Amphidinium_carterae.1
MGRSDAAWKGSSMLCSWSCLLALRNHGLVDRVQTGRPVSVQPQLQSLRDQGHGGQGYACAFLHFDLYEALEQLFH